MYINKTIQNTVQAIQKKISTREILLKGSSCCYQIRIICVISESIHKMRICIWKFPLDPTNGLAVANNCPYESGSTPLTSDEKLTYCTETRLPLWVGKVGLKLSPTEYDIFSLSNSLSIIYILHKLKIPILENVGKSDLRERRIPNRFWTRFIFNLTYREIVNEENLLVRSEILD